MKLSLSVLKRLLQLARRDKPPLKDKIGDYLAKRKRQDEDAPCTGSVEGQHSSIGDLVQHKISGAAVSFLIHVARFQDDRGNIQGLHYKETAKAIGCHEQYFYPVLKSLEYHDFIKVDWSSGVQGYWDIQILDNTFTSNADYKKGYINVNLEILQSAHFHPTSATASFHQMPTSDKIVLLHIIKNKHAFFREYQDTRREIKDAHNQGKTSKDEMEADLAFFNPTRMPVSYMAIGNWAGVNYATAKKVAERLSRFLLMDFCKVQVFIHLQGAFGKHQRPGRPSLGINLQNRATDKTDQTEAEVRLSHLAKFAMRLAGLNPDIINATQHRNLARALIIRKKLCIYEIFDGIRKIFNDCIGRISPRRLGYIYSSRFA